MKTTGRPPRDRDQPPAPPDGAVEGDVIEGDDIEVFEGDVVEERVVEERVIEERVIEAGDPAARGGHRPVTPGAPPFGGTSVDPRMRDRWVTARRAEGRRRLRLVAGVVVLLSVFGIAYLIAQSPLLGADTITVKGVTATTPDQVRAAARIEDGAPLLFLDTTRVARRVETLPGVARARVETDLPNTVVITVTERVAVAWTRTAGALPIAEVDATGRVIRLVAQPPTPLPEVVGTGGVATPGRTLADAAAYRGLAELPASLRLLAGTLTFRDGGGQLTISGAPPAADTIAFGPMTDMDQKGLAAMAVLNDLVAQNQRVGVLDVSVPSAPVTKGHAPLHPSG
ncbi:MAG: FtsQ-type POTRA domain-containing protein [Acidimicrobiia bacterium]